MAATKIVNIIEMILVGFALIISIIFFMNIKKNRDNLFYSMRSTNLMNITNILLLFNIISYSICDIWYEELTESKARKYVLTFYFVFQIGTFFSLILRYFRLYLSCKNTQDNLMESKMFEPKSYHYEYFYVRLIAGFLFLVLGITLIIFFAIGDDNTTLFSHELNFIKRDDHIELGEDNYLFWCILYFIETIIYMTFIILIYKTRLNPNVHIILEICLVSLINYIYSLSMGVSFFINKKEASEYLKDIIILFPLFYNFLIYFAVTVLPFFYGMLNTTVIMYDLPGELCSSLYLFLTKEKCYDAFYSYLSGLSSNKERAQSIYYLDLLISIFKYRLLISNSDEKILIREEKNRILMKLNENDINNYLDSKLLNDENLRNEKNLSTNLFDKIAKVLYEYLEQKFEVFKNTSKFRNLQSELIEETNIRCKLTNFGLIRN
jgi:hypothetical protein